MSESERENQGNDPWADVRKHLEDIRREPESTGRWATIKDRLAIVAVILVLLFLVFMMVDGSIENLSCSFADFITFECNRWDARWKSW